MKPRIYIESTIPSYLVSKPSRDLIVSAHQEITQEWWKYKRNNFNIYISQLVLNEISAGDTGLAKERLRAVKAFAELDITDEVTALASHILSTGIIPKKAATDAAHIAIAAVHGMNFLMTWNCAHIANAKIAKAIENICTERGFECPVICTPEELME